MSTTDLSYPTDDLGLLEAFCFTEPVTEFSTSDLMENPSLLGALMDKADLSVFSTSNVVVAFNYEWLSRVSENPGTSMSVVYYRNGPLNADEQQLIQHMTNKQNVLVRCVGYSVTPVVTDAQFMWQCERGTPKQHHFMVAADNHDLYSDHVSESMHYPHAHLIVQRGDDRLNRMITPDVRSQMETDKARYRNRVKAERRQGNTPSVMEVL